MGKNPFNIKYTPTSGDRAAYRAKIPGLHVKIAGRPAVYAAKDISPTGVGIGCGIGKREGQFLTINFFYKGRLVVSDLKCQIVRTSASFTGLTFVTPNRRQADAIHALVLDEQKRQAELRKVDKA